jgi:hypothetical protein
LRQRACAAVCAVIGLLILVGGVLALRRRD